jgi:hypothetical protein
MRAFFMVRGPGLAAVVLIMLIVSVLQAGITYTMTFGALRNVLPSDPAPLATVFVALRFGLVAMMGALWIMKRKRALFLSIIIVNALFTLALLIHISALMAVLFGSVAEAVRALIIDVVLMAAANILIFSIWYWIIDPPGVDNIPGADQPWHFLFPQRGASLPHYEKWVPHYTDYLFVAFTTSFAFSPTDVMPLTRRAKMLMMLQAAISIVTLTGIASSAINILAARS